MDEQKVFKTLDTINNKDQFQWSGSVGCWYSSEKGSSSSPPPNMCVCNYKILIFDDQQLQI